MFTHNCTPTFAPPCISGDLFLNSIVPLIYLFFIFFLRFYLFLERGREGGREGEKNQCVVSSLTLPLGIWPATQACALDWESNRQPFDLQAGTQPLSHVSQGSMSYLSILITSVLNSAPDRLVICILFSPFFLVLFYSFIWSVFLFLLIC